MYALLQTLISRGWVRTDATGSLYGIGLHALLTGTGYLDSDPRVRIVRPYLDEASEALGETIHLGRLDGRDVAYLATRMARVPAHDQPGGPAAARPTRARSARRCWPSGWTRTCPRGPTERFAPHTHTGRESLAADLARVRRRGYSVDREEGALGIVGFGFALRYDHPAQDAVSCSVPVARLTPAHERRIVAVMREIRAKAEASVPAGSGSVSRYSAVAPSATRPALP
ncbi:IclR family transcriptional regulator OS=Streptomyces fumanus OX=67302 GN=GCM10018772_03270 PE=4 SV=1 [Streptomyces fumanus]